MHAMEFAMSKKFTNSWTMIVKLKKERPEVANKLKM